MLINHLFFVFCSGYANRIHELLEVSRELSGVRDRLITQNSSAANYISEANYIEFSGVKVIIYTMLILISTMCGDS
jgi:hypothetical protein